MQNQGRPAKVVPLRQGASTSQATAPDQHSQTTASGQGDKAPQRVHFQRPELDAILWLYGRKVAAGEWRDYAIDALRDRAVFSIYRRTSEVPLYRIEKIPKLARRQGAYAVVAQGGRILKRGHDLKQVLRAIDRQSRISVVC